MTRRSIGGDIDHATVLLNRVECRALAAKHAGSCELEKLLGNMISYAEDEQLYLYSAALWELVKQKPAGTLKVAMMLSAIREEQERSHRQSATASEGAGE